MTIAAVVVTFGLAEHLRECLASLEQNRFIAKKPIVIDNTDNNRGFTGGYNEGIAFALGQRVDAVLLINDDTKVKQGAIDRLAQTLQSKPAGIVVPKIYFYPGFEFHRERYRKQDRGRVIWYAGGSIDWNNVLGVHRGVDEVDHGLYDRLEEIEFASGCCMLVTREVFERVGLLDERYFLYLEDLDFSVRARRFGWRILYQPAAVIWHKNALSSGVGSDLHDYFFTRNRMLFGLTYARWRTKLALVRESMRILGGDNHWKRRGIIDFYLRRYGKGSWQG